MKSLARRGIALLSLASLVLGVTGCTSVSMQSAKFQRDLAANTPAVQMVPSMGSGALALKRTALEAAERAAEEMGAVAFTCSGTSMEPLYRPGTALVVKHIRLDDVKRGMTVVYTKINRDGFPLRVAHCVVGEDAHGLVVQGLNNSEPDARSVNEENMIGVVVAAYAAAPVPVGSVLAMRWAIKTR